MDLIHFDTSQPIPIIDARIYGPRRSRKVKLIFDTGAEFTIIDTCLIEEIGYSARDAKKQSSVCGAVGSPQNGYLLRLQALRLFSKKASKVMVGAFDFDHFDRFGAHGVLGFDLIKTLHLEMSGPEGILKVY